MLVLDTSAYINGWRDHYPPAVFPGVWTLIADAMENGAALAPREVFRELGKKDDEVAKWAKALEHLFLEPSEEVQAEAGSVLALFPQPNTRNAADPFVIAEAKIRGFSVVTYEGRSFTGPTKNWAKRMPGICQKLDVACLTLPEALAKLGARFA